MIFPSLSYCMDNLLPQKCALAMVSLRFKQLSLENPFRGRARVGVRVHAHAPPAHAHDAKEDDSDLFGTAKSTFVHGLDDGVRACARNFRQERRGRGMPREEAR